MIRRVRALVACASLPLAAAAAGAFSLEPPILLPNGIEGSRGVPVPLTPSSFLVVTPGPDAAFTTADDEALYVSNLGGLQVVQPFAVPYQSDFSGYVVRLSATRAVTTSAGPDGSYYTADDEVQLIDGIGTTNTVTSIPVGPLSYYDYSTPVQLSQSVIALSGLGPDFSEDTADDTFVVVSDLGGTNTVDTMAAPWGMYPPRPSRIDPTMVLVASYGPDGAVSTADDVVYLFSDLGGANTRTDIPTPYLFDQGRAAIATRLTDTSALIGSFGPDGTAATADDGYYLLEDLGGANTVTPIAIPYLTSWTASQAVRLTATRAVVTTNGADGAASTADDALYLLDDLGGANTTTLVVLGYLNPGTAYRSDPLTPTRIALLGVGPDGNWDSSDDVVYVVEDLFGSNTVIEIPMPGVGDDRAFDRVALSPTAFLLTSGGPDGAYASGLDDVVNLVSGLPGPPLVQSIPSGGFDRTHYHPHSPRLLGGGRAVYVAAGYDEDLGSGDDDELRILANLPVTRHLTVEKLSIKTTSKGEKASVKAILELDEAPTGFGQTDVTVSIGAAAETIAAAAFTDKGKKIEYKAPKGSSGLVQKLVWQTEKGKLTIKAKGTGTGLENTDPALVPVALDFLALDDNLYLSDGVAGVSKGSKITYKKPK